MKRTWAVKIVASVMLAAACVGMAGCEAVSTIVPDEIEAVISNEPQIQDVELEWSGYTMGIDLISNDPERASVAGQQPEGQIVKICFKFLKDTNGATGFVSEDFFKNLESSPITLRDSSGNTYDFTGSIGDFAIKGDFATEGFAMEELQPRFSITFDVPTNLTLEDLTLVMSDGQELQLAEFISEEYAADTESSE